MRKRFVLALTAVALLTACSGSDPVESTPRPDRLKPPAEVSWTHETTPIGEAPVLVEDTVVAYVTEAGNPINLVGLDASTGEQKWSWRSSVQDMGGAYALYVRAVPDGEGGALIASTGEPVWSEAQNDWTLPFALIDPDTGVAIATIADMWVSSFYDCGLTAGVCLWAYGPGEHDEPTHFRFMSDGSIVPVDNLLPRFEASRYLGHGLYAVRLTAGTHALLRAEGGEALWVTPADELAATDIDLIQAATGWNLVPDDEVLTYEVLDVTSETTFRAPASHVQTGAVDYATGEVLWTRDGAVRCWTGRHAPVLCRGDIGYEQVELDGPIDVFSGDVTAIGVDLRTGEERWTREISALSDAPDGMQAIVLTRYENMWPYQDADGIQVLDTFTGEVAPLAGGAMVGCTEPIEVTTTEWSIPDSEPLTLESGIAQMGCTVDGEARDPATFTQAVVLGSYATRWVPAGAPPLPWDDEQLRLVQTRTAIVGYRF